MPSVSRNIVADGTSVLLKGSAPYGTVILIMSLCNTGSTPVTISLIKKWGENVDQTYYIIKNMTLPINRSFIYQNMILLGGWELQISVSGGTLDYDISFNKRISDT